MSSPRTVYAPEVIATENNVAEASKKFEQLLKDAPKPEDNKTQQVTVAPSIRYSGKTFNFSSLMASHGKFEETKKLSNENEINPDVIKKNVQQHIDAISALANILFDPTNLSSNDSAMNKIIHLHLALVKSDIENLTSTYVRITQLLELSEGSDKLRSIANDCVSTLAKISINSSNDLDKKIEELLSSFPEGDVRGKAILHTSSIKRNAVAASQLLNKFIEGNEAKPESKSSQKI